MAEPSIRIFHVPTTADHALLRGVASGLGTPTPFRPAVHRKPGVGQSTAIDLTLPIFFPTDLNLTQRQSDSLAMDHHAGLIGIFNQLRKLYTPDGAVVQAGDTFISHKSRATCTCRNDNSRRSFTEIHGSWIC